MNSTPDKPSGPAAPRATAAPTEDLIGEELLTYEVAGDGNWFRMRFTCANGKPGSLSPPMECLHALIMTHRIPMNKPFAGKVVLITRNHLCAPCPIRPALLRARIWR